MATRARPSTALRVCGLQVATLDAKTPDDRAENLRRGMAAVREQHGKGYRLFVMGELFAIGYGDDTLARLDVLAEDAEDGPSFRAFSAAACDADAYITYGFARRLPETAAGHPYAICHAVVGPDGKLVTLYDKLHLCSFGDCSETTYFSRGDTPCSFDVDGFTVGLMICYDIRFGKLSHHLAWERGADLLLYPSAFPKDIAFSSWHPFAITRALENQVYVLSLSRAGTHFGSSITVPPWIDGKPVSQAGDTIEAGTARRPRVLGDDPGALPVVVDPAELKRVRSEFRLRADAHPLFGAASGEAGAGAGSAGSTLSQLPTLRSRL